MRLCVLLLSLFATAARADDMLASHVEGRVTRGQDVVIEGQTFHPGDAIETSPDGRIEIQLPSGSLLRLGENSKLTLGEPQKKFSARLWLGNVWARVHKLLSDETFQVETENAVAGVRGTEFRVEVAQGQDDLLRVYEGAVQVDGREGKWSHRVGAAQELRYRKDREPKGPAAFDAESEKGHKFVEWVRSRRERNQRDRNPEREHRRRRRDKD